ncbi:hypothetical protein ACOME3_000421 [Neoechinorhynchus agilis]
MFCATFLRQMGIRTNPNKPEGVMIGGLGATNHIDLRGSPECEGLDTCRESWFRSSDDNHRTASICHLISEQHEEETLTDCTTVELFNAIPCFGTLIDLRRAR